MTLTINLTPEEEARLHETAARQGLAAEELVLKAVRSLLPSQDTAARLAALRSILEDEEAEQRETWEYLRRVLDEDRLSYRKLFP